MLKLYFIHFTPPISPSIQTRPRVPLKRHLAFASHYVSYYIFYIHNVLSVLTLRDILSARRIEASS